jgi:biotin transport system substrate-specific component
MATFANTKSSTLSILHSDSVIRISGITVFSILTVLGAKVEIPTYPVPFTLQTLFVLLSGAFLGKKDGAIAQLTYIMLGATGLPVFAGPISGFVKLLGPTGGYLIAFPIAAYFTGLVLEYKSGTLMSFIAMFAGSFFIFSLGVLYLDVFYINDLSKSVLLGLTLFSTWEIVKILAAAMITSRLKK